MQALETFAAELAQRVLGRHCSCWGEAFPAQSCDDMASEVAKAIAGGFVSHVAPGDLARSLMRSHCACHEVLRDGPCPKTLTTLEREVEATTKTIEEAFDARHLEEAHADAIASDIKGG